MGEEEQDYLLATADYASHIVPRYNAKAPQQG